MLFCDKCERETKDTLIVLAGISVDRVVNAETKEVSRIAHCADCGNQKSEEEKP